MHAPLETSKTLPTIHLFGQEEEGFYQLGLKDSESAKNSMKMINELISTQWESVNLVLHKALSTFIDQLYLKDRHFETLLNAYAQGANLVPRELLSSLLIPEICSFVGPWTKFISPTNFGCSSLFTLNEKNHPVHIRILDFPLKNTYDTYERLVYTDFKQQLKTLTYSSSGLPFAGLTSMNEAGLTVCLHQKFTENFNQHGLPIFYIAHKIITTCKNAQDVLELLERLESITCWNINVMDKNGEVLEIDLDGTTKTINRYNLHEKKFIYVCNRVLDQSIVSREITPLGMENYNDMRIESAQKISQKLIGQNNFDILKKIASPHDKNLTVLGPLTPSTMVCALFDPLAFETSYITGVAPKVYTSHIHTISQLWGPKKESTKTFKKIENERAKNLYNHLILAQHFFDTSDANNCYHHLQMALEISNEKERPIIHFFFIATQYIYEPHQMALGHLQEELQKIFPQLSDYFKDMAVILEQRISKLLGTRVAIEHSPTNEVLAQRFLKEKTSTKLVHQSLRKFTFLHLDIMDVIFI